MFDQESFEESHSTSLDLRSFICSIELLLFHFPVLFRGPLKFTDGAVVVYLIRSAFSSSSSFKSLFTYSNLESLEFSRSCHCLRSSLGF